MIALHSQETEQRADHKESAANKIFGKLKERVLTMKSVLEEQLGVEEDDESSEEEDDLVAPLPTS